MNSAEDEDVELIIDTSTFIALISSLCQTPSWKTVQDWFGESTPTPTTAEQQRSTAELRKVILEVCGENRFKCEQLLKQLDEEERHPVLPLILSILLRVSKRRRIAICSSTKQELETIISKSGGTSETSRASFLFSHLKVIKENPSERALSSWFGRVTKPKRRTRKEGEKEEEEGEKKKKSKDVGIFGTADRLGAKVLTSDRRFAEMIQRCSPDLRLKVLKVEEGEDEDEDEDSFFTFLHQPRSLTGI